MNICAKRGHLVVFTGECDYDCGQELASTILVVDETYVVDQIETGQWRTAVRLVGVPGSFDSALFEDAV